MNARNRKQRSDDGNAFLPESAASTGAPDELAELLAENHQAAVISGEDPDDATHDELQPEEIGGPFLLTNADQEYGQTRTAEIDADFEPSPMPAAVSSLATASPERQLEADGAELAELAGEDVDAVDDAPPVPIGPELGTKPSIRKRP